MNNGLGFPYHGSKNLIATALLSHIPSSDTFVDLFCGGGAMTHAALKSGRYKHFIMNDISGYVYKLYSSVANTARPRYFVTKEEFRNECKTDPFVGINFSYANKCDTYIYSDRMSLYEQAYTYAITDDDWHMVDSLCPEVSGQLKNSVSGVTDITERKCKIQRTIFYYVKDNVSSGQFDFLDNPIYAQCYVSHDTKFRKKGSVRDLRLVPHLASVMRSVSFTEDLLANKGRIRVFHRDYQDVHIPSHSVVYCDIPYRDTLPYHSEAFDYDRFYSWALSRDFPVFISEYEMPADFVPIFSTKKVNSISRQTHFSTTEKLFVQKKYYDSINNNITEMSLNTLSAPVIRKSRA